MPDTEQGEKGKLFGLPKKHERIIILVSALIAIVAFYLQLQKGKAAKDASTDSMASGGLSSLGTYEGGGLYTTPEDVIGKAEAEAIRTQSEAEAYALTHPVSNVAFSLLSDLGSSIKEGAKTLFQSATSTSKSGSAGIQIPLISGLFGFKAGKSTATQEGTYREAEFQMEMLDSNQLSIEGQIENATPEVLGSVESFLTNIGGTFEQRAKEQQVSQARQYQGVSDVGGTNILGVSETSRTRTMTPIKRLDEGVSRFSKKHFGQSR